jgi:hypothetical protein
MTSDNDMLGDIKELLTRLEDCVWLFNRAAPRAFANEVEIGGSGDEGEVKAGWVIGDAEQAIRTIKRKYLS